MADNQEIAVVEGEGEVVPISPADAKAWLCLRTVLEWMGENGSYNYSEAFRETGVERYNFYRAMKNPYALGQLANWFAQKDRATVALMHAEWMPILVNMAGIATSRNDARAAVAAARFLHEVFKEAEITTVQGEQPAESEAARLLKRWLGGGKPQVTLRQTRTVQEIELSDDD